MKHCNRCNTTKPLEDFYFNKKRNAYVTPCKACRKEVVTEWVANNRERNRANLNAWRARQRNKNGETMTTPTPAPPQVPGTKYCNHCDTLKDISEFYFAKKRGIYVTPCKACRIRYMSQWQKDNPERARRNAARYRERMKQRTI